MDIPSKEWQNLGSDPLLALASKLEGSAAALALVAVASVEVSEVIEAVSVVTEAVSVVTEAVSVTEVGLAVEEALATKVEVASEVEEASQTVLHHQMRPVDQADHEAVDTVVGTEPQMVPDPNLATVAVAMDMALVVNESIVGARAAQPGLTVAETNVVASLGAIENR